MSGKRDILCLTTLLIGLLLTVGAGGCKRR